jgi:hypothetical protein
MERLLSIVLITSIRKWIWPRFWVILNHSQKHLI